MTAPWRRGAFSAPLALLGRAGPFLPRHELPIVVRRLERRKLVRRGRPSERRKLFDSPPCSLHGGESSPGSSVHAGIFELVRDASVTFPVEPALPAIHAVVIVLSHVVPSLALVERESPFTARARPKGPTAFPETDKEDIE